MIRTSCSTLNLALFYQQRDTATQIYTFVIIPFNFSTLEGISPCFSSFTYKCGRDEPLPHKIPWDNIHKNENVRYIFQQLQGYYENQDKMLIIFYISIKHHNFHYNCFQTCKCLQFVKQPFVDFRTFLFYLIAPVSYFRAIFYFLA